MDWFLVPSSLFYILVCNVSWLQNFSSSSLILSKTYILYFLTSVDLHSAVSITTPWKWFLLDSLFIYGCSCCIFLFVSWINFLCFYFVVFNHSYEKTVEYYWGELNDQTSAFRFFCSLGFFLNLDFLYSFLLIWVFLKIEKVFMLL